MNCWDEMDGDPVGTLIRDVVSQALKSNPGPPRQGGR